MQFAKDAKRATKLLKRVLKGRRAYFELQKLLAKRGELAANHYRVGVYFADSDVNIYQMRQWYQPLQALHAKWPVVVLARNASGARQLLRESGLDVAFVPKVASLENFIAQQQQLDVILYVNQNTRNFQMMRYGERWHVFINHGESDKMYMTSNQHKAYDFALVAGEAARARLAAALWDYDVLQRTRMIGRPQADHLRSEPPYTPDARTVVLYAPTWEGDRPAAAYGSVLSHGEQLVRELLATGRHRVIYRPHPRSGVVNSDFGRANQRIIALLEQANQADPSAQHIYDDSPALGWQILLPDVAICDISAMVYDRLATAQPLLITRPENPAAVVDENGYLSECEWLPAAAARDIVAEIERVRADQAAGERLRTWAQRYFGDIAPGAPTARFHEAIAELLHKAERFAG